MQQRIEVFFNVNKFLSCFNYLMYALSKILLISQWCLYIKNVYQLVVSDLFDYELVCIFQFDPLGV